MDAQNKDQIIRDMLASCGSKFIPDKDINWRYWNENELKIRSCIECYKSQFYSEKHNEWPVYFTNAHTSWACEQLLAKKELYCKSCEERKPWYKPDAETQDE